MHQNNQAYPPPVQGTYNYGQFPTSFAPNSPGDIMQTQLFNCCETPLLCCCVAVAPVCWAAANQAKFDSCGWTLATCLLFPCCGTRNRTEVKKAVGAFDPATDSCCENCMLHTFCLVCALTQEVRAVRAAEAAGSLINLERLREHERMGAASPHQPMMR